VKDVFQDVILRHYLSMCLEGLRKTTKSLSQDIRLPGRDSNADFLIWSRSVSHSNDTFGL